MARPSLHLKATGTMGWMANLGDLEAGDKVNILRDEMLESLCIITPRERDLIAVEGVIGVAVNDFVSQALIEKRLRLSIGVKGKGRDDTKSMVGALRQSISIPTSIIKRIKNVNRGGNNGQVEEDIPA